MTQQNPGQPYIPPSASSGSGAYNPQQYQAQTSQYQAGGAASAQYQTTGAQAPYQPQASFQQTGQQFAMAPAQDSFFANLMDTSRDFVNKFGKLVFLVAVIAILVNLIYGAYNEGRSVSSLVRLDGDYNALQFLLNLLANSPWALAEIGLVRLFIELVRNTTPNRGAAA